MIVPSLNGPASPVPQRASGHGHVQSGSRFSSASMRCDPTLAVFHVEAAHLTQQPHTSSRSCRCFARWMKSRIRSRLTHLPPLSGACAPPAKTRAPCGRKDSVVACATPSTLHESCARIPRSDGDERARQTHDMSAQMQVTNWFHSSCKCAEVCVRNKCWDK